MIHGLYGRPVDDLWQMATRPIIKHAGDIGMNQEQQEVRADLAVTLVLLILLVIAVLLIADLIGAINVIG